MKTNLKVFAAAVTVACCAGVQAVGTGTCIRWGDGEDINTIILF